MGSSTCVDELHSRVAKSKEDDRRRQELFDELLSKLQDTTAELNKTRLDLQHEILGRRNLQEQNSDLTAKLAVKPYVVVIIDADGYIFPHINDGERGGEIVADKLVAAVKEQIRSFATADCEQYDIVVEMYASTDGLGCALIAQGYLGSLDTLRLFWTGFVCRQRLFSHVDVGRGKEKADQRIRDRVEFHSGILQCKRVFLACCHDKGYAPFLGPFVAGGKLALVKNQVCHAPFASLGLPIVEFRGVFVASLASGVVAMAGVGGMTNAGGKFGGSGKVFQNPFASQSRLGPVVMDPQSGLRCDRTFDVRVEALKAAERAKLCHWFYLIGSCKGCDKIHDVGRRLSADEFDALWTVARRGECYQSRKKKACTDALCIYGHKV